MKRPIEDVRERARLADVPWADVPWADVPWADVAWADVPWADVLIDVLRQRTQSPRMRKRWKLLGAAVAGVGVAGVTAFQLSRRNYEEPDYEVVAEHDRMTVRRYAPRVVAQTTVVGAEGDVTGEGFRRLAGYIFGGNDGGQSIAMTTPVERSPEGTTIDMTTPVERTSSPEGWVVTFTMPSSYTLDTLPTPNDSRVTLRELPAETVAALRFSGRADLAEKNRRVHELRELLAAHDLEPAGEPTLAQYDPPWVLGLFRRNEILIPVRSGS